MKTRSHFTPFCTKLCLVGVLLILANPGAMATTTAVTASQCETLFAKPIEARQLLQAIHNLAELQMSLDMVQAQGTQSPVVTALNANLRQKEAELLKYLEQHPVMTPEQLRERISRHIARLQNKNTKDRETESRRRREQKEQLKGPVIDGTRAVFHKVRPGSFKMGKSPNQVDVTLTTMPEVMATHMTQIIYKAIAELANKRFPGKYQIDPDPSHSKGDTRPVEKVSYDDAEKWAQALNDLSEAGEPALENLIAGHKKGMRYEAFMTEAQREYLMKKARTEDGDSIDEMIQREDTEKLEQYFAFDREGTVPVAQLKPLFIDDKPFYGLSGNVWEWMKDAWDGYSPPPGGVDPVGTGGIYRVTRGGSWWHSAKVLRSDYRSEQQHGFIAYFMGFRLVRASQEAFMPSNGEPPKTSWWNRWILRVRSK